ncbi:MAG: bile acid:sodium symporter [Bacteroidia bacterium]|nr:MAG: bile acid:sodium symporter [Bacteroidia bacterium]
MPYNLVDILISVVLALIMFGIGLSLTLKSFTYIFLKPRAMLTGLSAQLFLLPLLALGVATIFDLKPEFAVGLLILSVCPGGNTSNFVTFLLNGNTPLSISMTSINSLIVMFWIPFITNIGLEHFMHASTHLHLPYLRTVLQILFVILLPVGIGIRVYAKYPEFTKKLNTSFSVPFGIFGKIKLHLLKMCTVLLLAVVFGIKFLAGENKGGVGISLQDWYDLLPAGLVFNLAGLLAGFLSARLMRLEGRTPMTISIETGLQNTMLAILVASSISSEPEMQKPALIYATFSFALTFAFALATKYLRAQAIVRLRIKRNK